MLHDMTEWGGMMTGMGLPMLLLSAIVVLGIAALVKYVFFTPIRRN